MHLCVFIYTPVHKHIHKDIDVYTSMHWHKHMSLSVWRGMSRRESIGLLFKHKSLSVYSSSTWVYRCTLQAHESIGVSVYSSWHTSTHESIGVLFKHVSLSAYSSWHTSAHESIGLSVYSSWHTSSSFCSSTLLCTSPSVLSVRAVITSRIHIQDCRAQDNRANSPTHCPRLSQHFIHTPDKTRCSRVLHCVTMQIHCMYIDVAHGCLAREG